MPVANTNSFELQWNIGLSVHSMQYQYEICKRSRSREAVVTPLISSILNCWCTFYFFVLIVGSRTTY